MNFLSKHNNNITIKTDGSLSDDFYSLLYAPSLIASISSYSFFAGMGASTNQLFVYPSKINHCSYNYRKNMIPLPASFSKTFRS